MSKITINDVCSDARVIALYEKYGVGLTDDEKVNAGVIHDQIVRFLSDLVNANAFAGAPPERVVACINTALAIILAEASENSGNI